MLQDLGLSAEPTANLRHTYEHDRATEYDGHDYPETDADYTNVSNVDGGAFIAELNVGPEHMIQQKVKGGSIILVGSMCGEVCVRPQKQAAYNAV